ncbi:MAG: hypothetical protein P8Y23_12415 [Candidatus Lokiarchaeota archaeon]
MTLQDKLKLGDLKVSTEDISDGTGLTKEQILLKDMQNIAKEFQVIELAKKIQISVAYMWYALTAVQ